MEENNRNDILVDGIVWVINTILEALADDVFDVKTECLEEPMPQSFNGSIVHALHLQHRRKLFCVEFRCVCFPDKNFRFRAQYHKAATYRRPV